MIIFLCEFSVHCSSIREQVNNSQIPKYQSLIIHYSLLNIHELDMCKLNTCISHRNGFLKYTYFMEILHRNILHVIQVVATLPYCYRLKRKMNKNVIKKSIKKHVVSILSNWHMLRGSHSPNN